VGRESGRLKEEAVASQQTLSLWSASKPLLSLELRLSIGIVKGEGGALSLKSFQLEEEAEGPA
jgi:hypothetical protein